MVQRLDRVLGLVANALAYAACAIVTCIFAMIVIDVSIRTMGLTPPAFTLAVVEYSLLYFCMFSAPWLVRHRGHVAIEAVVAALPGPVRKVLAKMVYLVCALVSVLFAYYSVQLLLQALATMQSDIRGIDMPLWALFLPMPIAFFFVAAEFLAYLIGLRSYYSYDRAEVRDGV